jgi:hypothetical protein
MTDGNAINTASTVLLIAAAVALGTLLIQAWRSLLLIECAGGA